MHPPTTLIRAAAVRDGADVNARPGALLLRHGRIIAAGATDVVAKQSGRNVPTVDLPHTLLLPSMVNAHAHLELSNVDPIAYPGAFVDWLKTVIRRAPKTDADSQHAIQRGITLSLNAGAMVVGDITRSPATHSLRSSQDNTPLCGVSYLECFGIGAAQPDAITELQHKIASLRAHEHDTPTAHLGIQPHAPYSAGLDLYAAAAELARTHNLRLTTHLAETLEEIQFLQDATGPFTDLLRAMGKWDASIGPTGQHPVDWLGPRLAENHWLLAHCNYVDDRHLVLLADTGTSVAYCPVASDYFGHRRHRYRDMLDAGVNVCLGTDSLTCQPPNCDQPLGILPQMRHLYRRDHADPSLLLGMATTHGARALGFPASIATLQPGSPATVTAIKIDPDDPTDPLTQALKNNEPLTPLTLANH